MRPWLFSTVSAQATSGAGCSQGGSVAEGDGDVAMQLGLVRLHDKQIVALGVPHMAADLALGEDAHRPSADRHRSPKTHPPRREQAVCEPISGPPRGSG